VKGLDELLPHGVRNLRLGMALIPEDVYMSAQVDQMHFFLVREILGPGSPAEHDRRDDLVRGLAANVIGRLGVQLTMVFHFVDRLALVAGASAQICRFQMEAVHVDFGEDHVD